VNWKHLAGPALLLAVGSACTGGTEPQAGPPTIEDSVFDGVSAPPSSEPTTSSAPTTISESGDAPSQLAFASSSDIGRLFSVASSGAGLIAPDAEAETSSQLASGQLVQATKARKVDSDLWVQVRNPEDSESLGWLLASQLLPTTESIITTNADKSGELRVVGRVKDELPIHTGPGSDSTDGSLADGEITFHGGTTALAADGETWVDVTNSAGTGIGWVRSDNFQPIERGYIRTSDGQEAGRRADSGVTYGAPIGSVSIGSVGCNAAQIIVTSSDSSKGLAVVFGTATPTGRELRSTPNTFAWSAPGGAISYADPGLSLTLTVLTQSSTIWSVASLADNGQAEFARSSDGNAVLDESGRAAASNVQSTEVLSSTCGTPVVEPEPDPALTSEAPQGAEGTPNPGEEGEGTEDEGPGAPPPTSPTGGSDPVADPQEGAGGVPIPPTT
jgi:hypothetical protein